MVLMFIDLYDCLTSVTFGRACSRSAELKQAWFCTCLIAAVGSPFGHCISSEGVSQIEFRKEIPLYRK